MSESHEGNQSWGNFQLRNYWAKDISKDGLKQALDSNLQIPDYGPNLVNDIPTTMQPLLVGIDRCTEIPVSCAIVLVPGNSINFQKPTLEQCTTEVWPSAVIQASHLFKAADSSQFSPVLHDDIGENVDQVEHVNEPSVIRSTETVQSLDAHHAGVRVECAPQIVKQEPMCVHCQGIQTTVPTAKCVLSKQSLKLSKPVIADLKTIQKKLSEHCDEKVIQEGCVNYFRKYGTHVNLGEFHFGGKYKWEARYHGVERDTQIVKAVVESSLNDYILNGHIATSDKNNVNVQTLQVGGPECAPSFELWKVGLFANSSSWAVIHQSSNYIGIWDILQNHNDGLQDVTCLCHSLKHAWMQVSSDVVTPHGNGEKAETKQQGNKLDQTNPDTDLMEKINPEIRLAEQTSPYISMMSVLEEINPDTVPKQQTSMAIGAMGHINQEAYQTQQTNTDMKPTQQTKSGRNTTQQANTATGQRPQTNVDISLTLQNDPDTGQSEQTKPDKSSMQQTKPYMGSAQQMNQEIDSDRAMKQQQDEIDKGPQINLDIRVEQQNKPCTGMERQSNLVTENEQLSKQNIEAGEENNPAIGKIKMDCGSGENLGNGPLSQNIRHADPSEDRVRISNNEIQEHSKNDQIPELSKTDPFQMSSDEKPDLLHYLQLENYYPEKISVGDVMAIVNEPINQSTVANVGWDILKKLIMLDHQGFSSEIERCARSEKQFPGGTDSDCKGFADFQGLGGDSEEFNPQDVFLIIFACCDLNLRQILLQKMHMCRLAVPVLSPNICDPSLTYNLWALRSIILSWRDTDNQSQQSSAVDYPIHVASYIRLQRPDVSKSKLLNDVLSDQHHDTFFNEDCPNGNIERAAADGLIEGSYFLPSGKEKDMFKNVTLFLNLRGDGIQLKEQVDILNELSNVMVVCVDIADINHPDSIATMERIHRNTQNVVIVFSDRKGLSTKMVNQRLQEYSKNIGYIDPAHTCKVFAFRSRNASQIKTDSRVAIANALVGNRGKILQDFLKLLLAKGMHVDEMAKTCQDGNALAKTVTSCISHDKTKSELLPLQGKHWKELCKLLKRKKRSRQGTQTDSEPRTEESKMEDSELCQDETFEEIERIAREMNENCKGQETLLNTLGCFMSTFIDGLKETIDTPMVEYYLQWLKMFLDERSRKELGPLKQRYHEKLRMYKQVKNASGNLTAIESQLTELETQLESACFGMEHLMREMGQIYEAAMNSPDKQHHLRFSRLPYIAAKLLLKGHALEIVDGDASGVPLKWLSAVFTQLKIITGDKNVFCLSVLGIQSSGKSTLLNTMFGLQFPISAGRCTRGVYMQLVKVASNTDFPFDYVAVIDSEGLRAPELGESKLEHDNELATFVIGLGNVIVINIKGGDIEGMKDVLQIVSHAFLRMKIVNKSIQKDRSCVFVHQNVPAVDAREMMASGVHKLEEALDTKTIEAAQLENMVGIHSFNEIIKFDNQKNVWYFPDLWTGNPPMACVNTGYYEKVSELKSDIINELAKECQMIFGFSQMKDLINDMWYGVLSDDFVFGFRNTLVTKAYNRLEKMYTELKWKMEIDILDWMNNIHWDKLGSQDDLQQHCGELKKEVVDVIYKKEKHAAFQLELFIENDSQKAIMHPWKEAKYIALQYAAEMACIKVQRKIDDRTAEESVAHLRSNDQGRHKKDILSKAEKLAEDLKGSSLTDTDYLNQEFENMWDDWIISINNPNKRLVKPISVELVGVLYDMFPGHKNLVYDILCNDPLNIKPKHPCLFGSFSIQDFDDDDLSFEKRTFALCHPRSTNHKAKISVIQMLDEAFKQMDACLAELFKTNSGFQILDARRVFKCLVDEYNRFNGIPNKGFSTPIHFGVKVAVHAARYILPMFKRLQTDYDNNLSAAAQLKAYKQTTRNLFLNLVTQKSEEIIVVDMVCDQLEELVSKQVKKKIHLEVVKEIVPHFLTKRKLIKAILQDLAEKEQFSSYETYISDPKLFSLIWVTNYSDEYIFTPNLGSCWYASHCKEYVKDLIKDIWQAIEKACTAKNLQSTHAWLKTCVQELSGIIPLTETDLQHITQYMLQDFKNLAEPFKKRIDMVKSSIIASFEEGSLDAITWSEPTPYNQILDCIWGCTANCPFCMEPCIKSDLNHVSTSDPHECLQHRPQGVLRWHVRESKVLVIGNCNFLVQTPQGYYCGGCSKQICDTKHAEEALHKYSDVRKDIRMWRIAPCQDMDSSKYWMWFLSKFQSELVEGNSYKLELAKIPDSWLNITKKNAIASLFLYD